MATLEKRNGKIICVEPEGEWEYADILDTLYIRLIQDGGNQVKAIVFDYFAEIYPYENLILFEVDGELVEQATVDGIATITLDIGTHVIKTVNEGLKNSEITIEVI